MDFRIIAMPPFKAACSGADREFDFSSTGILGKFDAYFSSIRLSARDSFMPRDFMYYDEEKQGMVWIWALSEGMDNGGYEVMDFDGGYYLTYVHKDGDDEAGAKLYDEAMEYIRKSGVFETDIRPNHYVMGHIITPPEIASAQGWEQMENLIPIRLKK